MRYWYDTEFAEDGRVIDLISIGIVAEDGRELYLESADFDREKANQWARDHVFPQLKGGQYRWPMSSIRVTLRDFFAIEDYGKPELWGYFAAYDHVVFCQIFGTMMHLPKGFPMYTHDLKQWCDQLGNPQLPTQGTGEHNSLADARWNKQVWEFLDESSNAVYTQEQLDDLATRWNAVIREYGGEPMVVMPLEAQQQLRRMGLLHTKE